MIQKSIPTEILLQIITHLNPNDKNQGLLICREWYKVFLNSLYYNIHIENECQLGLLFQTLSKHGYLVRHLSIQKRRLYLDRTIQDKIIIPRLLFEQLPDLCPNLETLDFDPETWKFICFHMSILKWGTSVRQLPTLSTIGPSLPFLQSLGTSLSSLSIHSEMILDISTRNKLVLILSLVPRITEFTIQGSPPPTLYLHVEDIELIHDKLPCLESFTMLGNIIQMPIVKSLTLDDHAPTAVPLIKKLHWNISVMPSSWLTYVVKKYPNVQDLVLSVQNNISSSIVFPRFEGDSLLYTQLVKSCRHLKKIQLSSTYLDDWFNASFFENLSPSVQQVSPILKKNNSIKYDVELLLAALPDNRKLIKALEIEQWRLNMKLSFTLVILEGFTQLSYLYLKCDSYNDTHDIEYLLQSCSSLESLVLEWGSITLANVTTKRHPLKSLCLTFVAFEPGVFNYLSNKCRSLSTLLLTKCKQLCQIQDVITQTVIQLDMPFNKFDLIMMDGIRLDYSNAYSYCQKLTNYVRVASILEKKNAKEKWYHHVGYSTDNHRKIPISQIMNETDTDMARAYFLQREKHSFIIESSETLVSNKNSLEPGYIKINCLSLRNFILDGNFTCP